MIYFTKSQTEKNKLIPGPKLSCFPGESNSAPPGSGPKPGLSWHHDLCDKLSWNLTDSAHGSQAALHVKMPEEFLNILIPGPQSQRF